MSIAIRRGLGKAADWWYRETVAEKCMAGGAFAGGIFGCTRQIRGFKLFDQTPNQKLGVADTVFNILICTATGASCGLFAWALTGALIPAGATALVGNAVYDHVTAPTVDGEEVIGKQTKRD